MENILHVTNGDSTVELFLQACIEGKYLAWRDVLHEGATPSGLDLHALSNVRADYIAQCGWSDVESARKSFKERDLVISEWRKYDAVYLWFEHDLYDQLQLIQILDIFAKEPQKPNNLFLIQHNDYLGMQTPATISTLKNNKKPVTNIQLQLATKSWEAFRSNNPTVWWKLLGEDTTALPWLKMTITRHLEQFPFVKNGLNRTENIILSILIKGSIKPGQLFHEYQLLDEPRYMGDASFWIYLKELCSGDRPLIALLDGSNFKPPSNYPPDEKFKKQKLYLTEFGQQVLYNKADWVNYRGVDKWLGGCKLTTEKHWRWDDVDKRLTLSS
ncbi:MAG: DUF1835 domain-containing protein [Magnetococcales bacterium]|nr:DUF1835 domain-containing protein [Magnetococcales bacterium]